jgi:hypothetical protein
MNKAIEGIIAERRRQDGRYGGAAHDDRHADGSLTVAAVVYALDAIVAMETGILDDVEGWRDAAYALNQISPCGHKPATARRNLEKAAALLVAEIERLDRAAS